VALYAYRAWGHEKGAACHASRAHEFFFVEKLLKPMIAHRPFFHGAISFLE
jgi:hypothetical protein